MSTEAVLAAAVADWLRSEGWEVYFEVSLEWKERRRLGESATVGDGRADIVATRGGLVAVVECKQTLSFDLFAQVVRWVPYADFAWIAVPRAKRSDGRAEAMRIARGFYGVGVLEHVDGGIVVRAGPRVGHCRTDDALLLSLAPEHQTHAAPGTNRSGQWTTFKASARAISEYVAKHPEGCTVDEIVEATGSHHYANKRSALTSIRVSAKRGQIPGVRVGSRQKLFPTSSPELSVEGAS